MQTVFLKPEKNNQGDFADSNVKIGLGLGLGLMGEPKSIFKEKFAQTLRNGLYGGYMEFLLCIC